MMFSDTHCHVFAYEYDNYKDILDNLPKNNIKRIICNGYNLETNKEVIDEIKAYDYVYGALGIHPDNIDEYNKENIDYILDNINNPKVLACGEIGLDYFHNKDNKLEQIKLFEEMLNIAENFNKPVIIHSRDATMDTINVLKKHHVRGVIHSFSGSYETACEYIKMGFKLGVNGVLTFKNANLPEVIKKISLEYLLIETDSPCLTPAPFRGEKNDPKNVYYVALKLCEIKNISMEDLGKNLENNFNDVFDI